MATNQQKFLSKKKELVKMVEEKYNDLQKQYEQVEEKLRETQSEIHSVKIELASKNNRLESNSNLIKSIQHQLAEKNLEGNDIKSAICERMLIEMENRSKFDQKVSEMSRKFLKDLAQYSEKAKIVNEIKEVLSGEQYLNNEVALSRKSEEAKRAELETLFAWTSRDSAQENLAKSIVNEDLILGKEKLEKTSLVMENLTETEVTLKNSFEALQSQKLELERKCQDFY